MQRFLQELRSFLTLFGASRFIFLCFLAASCLLLLWGRPDPYAFPALRGWVLEISAPLLDAAALPVRGAGALAEQFTKSLASHWNTAQENARLREENASLLKWRRSALALEARLSAYEKLLNAAPETPPAEISARVIADKGSPYVKTLIIASGAKEGVQKGQAVMTHKGLAGRVIYAGRGASRVLLLSDLNSRVPVIIGREGHRALLIGANTAMPRLDYYQKNTTLRQGDPILTSGHGGLMPPGLFVGTLVFQNETAHAQLAAQPDSIMYVRVLKHPSPKAQFTLSQTQKEKDSP